MEQVPVQDLDIIALLTRPGTYVLGVAIFIATFFLRRLVENAAPWLKKQNDVNSPLVTYITTGARWWNEVILPVVPVVFGILAAFLNSDFFFDGIGDKGGKFLFAICVGWFSSFLYKALGRVLKQKLGKDLSPPGIDSEAPPPMSRS